MKKSRKSTEPSHPFFKLIMLFCLGLCGVSLLILYVHCVDRVSEFMNGWDYQNKWLPFKGTFIDYVQQLPKSLKNAVVHFPEASFATLIFFPLVVVIFPLYDLFTYGDYQIFLNGFLPFFVGVGIFVWAGILFEKS